MQQGCKRCRPAGASDLRSRQSKSAWASRPQALEQPSPRTAHVAKIGLIGGGCKQNLGNLKVITCGDTPLSLSAIADPHLSRLTRAPWWHRPVLTISTGHTACASSRMACFKVSSSTMLPSSSDFCLSNFWVSSSTAGPAPLSVTEMTPWLPARGSRAGNSGQSCIR